MQALTIDAVEFDQLTELPVRPGPVESATFRVQDGALELLSCTRNLGIFDGQRFPIHPRLAWHLARSETVSVVIETPTTTSVASFTVDARPPQQLFH